MQDAVDEPARQVVTEHMEPSHGEREVVRLRELDEAQTCEVTPAWSSGAASSAHEYMYLPSSRSAASVVRRSGLNVSHITAYSCVSVMPSDFSASPGCGPCGSPEGCSVIDPTSMPFRDEKFPST